LALYPNYKNKIANGKVTKDDEEAEKLRRAKDKTFWNAMLSDTDNYACQQAEGFCTWKSWFNNKLFRTVFLKILKSLHLTEKDIDNLIELLTPAMSSIAHICQSIGI
jgi:hypothetical protein